MGKRVVVATHGHCFDGMASAVLFTRLIRHVDPEVMSLGYRTMGYGPGQNGVDAKVMDGDENAILDYRFSPSEKLSWYFDHHVSAFPGADDRSTFEARAEAQPDRFFHNGTYGSCTKLIADIGKERFGFEAPELKSLIEWADMIDKAAFPNAKMPVERSHPVLKLMTVVEHGGDDTFMSKMVPRFLMQSLEDIARSKEIERAYAPLAAEHAAYVELVKTKSQLKGPVVFVDLSGATLEVAGKFVTYALYPESVYSVVLSRSSSKCKLSIGYNPWCGVARTHNIAKICERYGGGGHPVVGAVSTLASELEKAQRIALEIVEELSGPPTE